MARRTTEQYVSQMEKTADYYKQKADREYAYYKNDAFGDRESHYLNSQKAYEKEKECREKADNARRNGY